MAIIKNFMGGSDNTNNKGLFNKQALHSCSICQEAFKQTPNNHDIHCANCVDNGRVAQADYWRDHFKARKANSLSPDMDALYNKLANKLERKSLLEGKSAVSRLTQNSSVRSQDDIIAQQSGKNITSFEVIRDQVMEYLPNIIAELGLSNKMDIELVADMIVPAKIHTPLHDSTVAKSVIKNIVLAELGRFHDNSEMIRAEASVKTKSKSNLIKTAAENPVFMNEGISRVGGSGFSRQFDRIANPMMNQMAPPMPAPPTAPPTDMPPMDAMNAPMPSESGAPIGEGDPHDMNAMPSADQQGGMGAAPEPEVVGDVTRVPDDQSMEESGGMPTMNEGIIPNSEQAFYNQMPDLNQAPPDGTMNRVQQSASPRVRVVKPQTSVKKPHDMSLFTLAGRVAKNVPVQAIKLDASVKAKLLHAPVANYLVANYNDGTSKTWNFYKVDRGGIFTSADSEFYAENPKKFAEFIATDRSFSKFAFIPEELQTQDHAAPNSLDNPLPGIGELPLPGASDNDTLSVNEIEPTVLNPSGENAGMMNDQDSIFNNQESHPTENPTFGLDDLGDHAADLLPDVEHQMPDASPDTHLNTAIAWAADLLNGIRITAAEELPFNNHPDYEDNESHEAYIKRLVDRYGPGLISKFKRFDVKNPSGATIGDFLDMGGASWDGSSPLKAPNKEIPTSHQVAGDDPGTSPIFREHHKQIMDAAPMVSGDVMVPDTAPTGQVVDVPLDKKRQEVIKNIAPPESAPKLAPIYKDLSNVDPPGLPKLTEEYLFNNPEYDDPASSVKYIPYALNTKKRKENAPQHHAASLDILEVTAGMDEAEFYEVGLPSLVEAGYTDDEIITALAMLEKIADGDDAVFSDYNAVSNVLKPKKVVDEDTKHALWHATDEDVSDKAHKMMDAKVEAKKKLTVEASGIEPMISMMDPNHAYQLAQTVYNHPAFQSSMQAMSEPNWWRDHALNDVLDKGQSLGLGALGGTLAHMFHKWKDRNKQQEPNPQMAQPVNPQQNINTVQTPPTVPPANATNPLPVQSTIPSAGALPTPATPKALAPAPKMPKLTP